MAALHCPTCGADLGGRAICSRCGTLAGIEFGFARVQARARRIFNNRFAGLPQSLAPHHFLWACAVMPLFLLPPFVSLTAALARLRKPATTTRPADYEWIAIISAINLILSGLVLYKFHFSPSEIMAFVGDLAKAFTHTLFQWGPGQRPPVRVIPI